jgi:prolipoprotein diacylglyceryltransferase
MVGGVYLILSGIGRFVEEAYRGEPQTPMLWGMRLYQWIAIVTVFLGAAITTLERTPLTREPIMHVSSVVVALVCGIAAWIVSGVDFPDSSRRFARLS